VRSSVGATRSSAMTRVLALVPDLLFGSRVQSALEAAGHEVDLIAEPERLRERLSANAAAGDGVLVFDLTDPGLDGSALLEALRQAGSAGTMRALGFYSHVDASARERAERAGFDLVVPRSRMAREAAELVAGLSAKP
jgi:CheY-like chemotaxis protein